MFNVKTLEPGTLIKFKKPVDHRLSKSPRYEISYSESGFDIELIELNDKIVTFLEYKEIVEKISTNTFSMSAGSTALKTISGFVVKIKVLLNERKFWVLITLTNANREELPDDLKNPLRECNWISLFDLEEEVM